MTATAGYATMWLHRQEDVAAHLCFAAAEIGEVQLKLGALSVVGRLGFPDIDLAAVPVEVPANTPAPEPGEIVHVSYEGPSDRYAFLSEILDTTHGRTWRLAAPRAVERNDRRIAPRHRVVGDPRFGVVLRQPSGPLHLGVYDLSSAGVGLLVDTSRVALPMGAQYLATLAILDDRIACTLQIRNSRPLAQGDTVQVVGTSFTGLSPRDRARIASLLASR